MKRSNSSNSMNPERSLSNIRKSALTYRWATGMCSLMNSWSKSSTVSLC